MNARSSRPRPCSPVISVDLSLWLVGRHFNLEVRTLRARALPCGLSRASVPCSLSGKCCIRTRASYHARRASFVQPLRQVLCPSSCESLLLCVGTQRPHLVKFEYVCGHSLTHTHTHTHTSALAQPQLSTRTYKHGHTHCAHHGCWLLVAGCWLLVA